MGAISGAVGVLLLVLAATAASRDPENEKIDEGGCAFSKVRCSEPRSGGFYKINAVTKIPRFYNTIWGRAAGN